MTTALTRYAKAIESVREAERNKHSRCDCGADLLDKPDHEGCRGMGWEHIRERLAALPRPDDEAAVEELAAWLGRTFGDTGRDYDDLKDQWEKTAKAVLTVLAGGGGA